MSQQFEPMDVLYFAIGIGCIGLMIWAIVRVLSGGLTNV